MGGWGKGGVVFLVVAMQALSPLFVPKTVVAEDLADILSPILSPVLNGLCNAVECGKGTCKVSMNQTFGFACECNPGWKQLHIGDHFRFLPCVIPNCSVNYSCSNLSSVPAPAPLPPPPSNLSLFDPCEWSYCGEGECSATSTYEHRCQCHEGFSNLFNVTSFPCYKDCSLGADCANLGINVSNSSSPPNQSDNGSSSGGDTSAPKKLLWLFVLMLSLAIVWAT